jgi:hypothetical protein
MSRLTGVPTGAKSKERMALQAELATARELLGYKKKKLSAGHLKALTIASRTATAVLPGEARERQVTRSC